MPELTEAEIKRLADLARENSPELDTAKLGDISSHLTETSVELIRQYRQRLDNYLYVKSAIIARNREDIEGAQCLKIEEDDVTRAYRELFE